MRVIEGEALPSRVSDGDTINADGTDLTALTDLGGYLGGLYWAPDGTTLLFESNVSPADAGATIVGSAIWATTLSPGAVAAPITVPAYNIWDFHPRTITISRLLKDVD